jgi:hypothetical protein
MIQSSVNHMIKFCQKWQNSVMRFDERIEMHDKWKALSEGAGYS